MRRGEGEERREKVGGKARGKGSELCRYLRVISAGHANMKKKAKQIPRRKGSSKSEEFAQGANK